MTTKEKPRSKNGDYTHIAIILDRSGSMSSLKLDTIGGFNSFLKKQQEQDGKGTITLVQFATNHHIVDDMAPLEKAELLTNQNYDPSGGSTALLDTLGRSINHVESKIEDAKEKPDKVVFVVITDGLENDSREFSRKQVMDMIKRHEDEMGWDFVFIGANQDSIQEGGRIGVRSSNAMNYAATSKGVQHMYRSLSSNMSSYRRRSKGTGQKIGFFVGEDEEEEESTN
jgi:Mg-chelatase subunit ChlD